MTAHLKKGDKIKGDKIRCEARKIKILKPGPKTSVTKPKEPS